MKPHCKKGNKKGQLALHGVAVYAIYVSKTSLIDGSLLASLSDERGAVDCVYLANIEWHECKIASFSKNHVKGWSLASFEL